MQRNSLISVFFGQLIFFFLRQASSANYRIITDETPRIVNKSNNDADVLIGSIVSKSFLGPNKGNWTTSVAQFQLDEDNKLIFALGNDITIEGNNSLSLNSTGDFTIDTTLDVSGRLVEGASHDNLFRVGGFVRTSNSCCVLGAGPGAAFSYHGAGHGGRGGGFYQDRNSSRYYSWDYHNMEYMMGGSTSTVMFESKPGSGGGAIEIITSGTLTINAAIKADGFTSKDTHEEHCAGGSAGGLIRLKGKHVVIKNMLSAKGGDSGNSNNTGRRCGDGGGGGVVQVFTETVNTSVLKDKEKIHIHGGSGIEKGESGIIFYGVFFDEGKLKVDTEKCRMEWFGILLHSGTLKERKYRKPNNIEASYKVCEFVFDSDVHLGSKADISLQGNNSLKIESRNGGIQLMTKLDVTGKVVGGYKLNEGPGSPSNCNYTDLYKHDLDILIGGSVCTESNRDPAVVAQGGGAIELQALNGVIVIGSKIITDGSSNKNDVVAMGGIIRLKAKEVQLKPNAFLSAKSSKKGSHLASGGIIQILSHEDVQGMCESKFESGSPPGVVNIMTTASTSFQVQFINDMPLLVNTDLCTWEYTIKSNQTITYSKLGTKTYEPLVDGVQVTVCSFDFQTPIIVNHSAVVQLSGQHALSINSKEGIYLGVDLVADSSGGTGTSSFLGGFCVNSTQAGQGAGPGKGFPGINAGGGHGGRGGLFKEYNNVVYGKQYGVESFSLIGGSTGTSENSTDLRACGGGAIRITSERTLTIAGKIQVNGYTYSDKSTFSGGSSGGRIILNGTKVILTDDAQLEAKGSNAIGNISTGGGGGGVIIITSKNESVANIPNVEKATAGGSGEKNGECGVLIVNGKTYRKQYNPDVEMKKNFTGCYSEVHYLTLRPHTMLEHTARPTTCLQHCRSKAFPVALINERSCYCVSEERFSKFKKVSNDSCNASCPATHEYICGGGLNQQDIFSVYTTGVKQPVVPTTQAPTQEPTERPHEKPSEELVALNNVSITKNNSQEVVSDLKNLTTTTDLNGGDTQVAVDILKKLASGNVLALKHSKETKQTGQAIADIGSALLGSENSENWKKMSNNNTEAYTPNNVLEVIEKIGVELGSGLNSEEQVVLESSHLAMGIERRDLSSFKGGTYPVYGQLSKMWQFEDSISIPEESIAQLKESGANHTTVVFVLYNGVNEVLRSNVKKGRMINSRIISLQFGHSFLKPFVKPVNITLAKKENWENLTDPECSFLDFTNISGGNWSNHGCVMTSSVSDPMMQCQCDHLTNFAVLMQVKEFKISSSHQKALQMITYIGCGISLFGLALTLATFLSLETLASERTSIHKNLVVAIGLAQIIFLAGIDAVYNYIACKIVALSLHYLYMAAFAWMCCEGIHLYTKVIEVFSSEASKMKYYYMLGWGAPLIIIIISAASRIGGYGTPTACWISIQDGLIWAFVGPVLIIMCINFVVMVMVIKVILASVTAIQTPGNTSQVKAGLKGMVVLLPLLGLTWVFGLMAVNEKTIAFQYIFAILNSLQGLFIFAFHCIGNSEVRVAYKRLHEKRTLGKMPEHSLSSGNHHKDFKKRMNSRETNSTGDEDIIVTKAIRSVSDVKLSGGQDHVAMQTFGDADSGRWSLNCPSPDPPCVSYLPTPSTRSPRREQRTTPLTDVPQQPATPRESYRSNRNIISERNRFVNGEAEGQINGYQRF